MKQPNRVELLPIRFKDILRGDLRFITQPYDSGHVDSQLLLVEREWDDSLTGRQLLVTATSASTYRIVDGYVLIGFSRQRGWRRLWENIKNHYHRNY